MLRNLLRSEPWNDSFLTLTEPQAVALPLADVRVGHDFPALVVPDSTPGALAHAARSLPTDVACLLAPPTTIGALIVPRVRVEAAPLEWANREAAWQAFVRCVEANDASILLVESTNDDRDDLPIAELQPLVPAGPRSLPEWLRSRVEGWLDADGADSSPERVAVQAGLLLWHDFLDASHRQAQSVEGEGRHRNADCWHAVLHRREPDYANSKYWFRQVERHPMFEQLAAAADRILQRCPAPEAAGWARKLRGSGKWDAFAFVDLCAACAASEESPLALAARQIQRAEMLLLLERSCADAGC